MGSKLGSIRDELVGLSVKIGSAYPIKLSDDLAKAVRIIDKVRSDLEDEMLKENPELDNQEALNIYYGTRSRNISSTEPEHDLNRTE